MIDDFTMQKLAAEERRRQQIERFPPIETPQEKLSAMRGDFEDTEGLEFMADPPIRGDVLAIAIGLCLAFWTVAVIGLIKAWPWVSATVAGWL